MQGFRAPPGEIVIHGEQGFFRKTPGFFHSGYSAAIKDFEIELTLPAEVVVNGGKVTASFPGNLSNTYSAIALLGEEFFSHEQYTIFSEPVQLFFLHRR